MSSKLKVMFVFFVVCMGVFIIANGAIAAKPIAKVTAFKGEVILLSGIEVKAITQTGVALNDGDKLQTKNGEAEVTFDDGAVMKLNPFTASMIEEREEEAGWLFKTKTTARRLTVFVGKLFFSSGSSNKQNILQTPSAVCGLRGSKGEIGYNNYQSFLNMIEGQTQLLGQFVRGVFDNPGVDAALKNRLYQALLTAHEAYNKAEGQQDVYIAQKAALEAIQVAALELKENNPDQAVSLNADKTLTQTNTLLEQTEKKIQETPKEMRRQRSFPTIPLSTGQPTTTNKPVSPIRKRGK